MIHKRFDYRVKLVWVVILLIICFSTASSMIKKESAVQNNDPANICIEASDAEFSILYFLNN